MVSTAQHGHHIPEERVVAVLRSLYFCTAVRLCVMLAIREPVENLSNGSVGSVRDFDRLKHQQRVWTKLPLQQQLTQPYPVAPVSTGNDPRALNTIQRTGRVVNLPCLL